MKSSECTDLKQCDFRKDGNMLNLSSGTVYILDSGENQEELGTVSSCNIECSDYSDYDGAVISINRLEASIELFCRLSNDLIMTITGMRDAILKCCPNRRVVHLSIHGKKKRTRNKNLKRAIKILERIAEKEESSG